MMGEFGVVERPSIFMPREGIDKIPKYEVPFGLAVTLPSALRVSFGVLEGTLKSPRQHERCGESPRCGTCNNSTK